MSDFLPIFVAPFAMKIGKNLKSRIKVIFSQELIRLTFKVDPTTTGGVYLQ